MSKRVKQLSQLKDGQHAVANSFGSILVGTVKVVWQRQTGPHQWEDVAEPEVNSPMYRKRYKLVVMDKKPWPYSLDQYDLEKGILVGDGPCKPCDSLGLVRDRQTGEHRQCKLCFGGWLS